MGSGLRAPAAADLLLEFDHPDVTFGLVVVERDAEVVREPQDVGAVGVESGEQGSRGTPCRPSALAGRWWWWVELVALTEQGVVALAERGQPPGRQAARSAVLGDLDRDVQFDEQLSKLGGPRLAGELGDPGQFP